MKIKASIIFKRGIKRIMSYDFLIKLLIIGDSGVGKSCLLLRFADDSFTNSFITTIGIDFKIKTLIIDEKRVRLQIWDSAGQERFRTITNAYYRGAMGIILVYDVGELSSFQNISNWLGNIEKHSSNDVYRILLGNKCDVYGRRQIEESKGREFAQQHGIKFFETSAKNNINVNEAFTTVAKDIKKKLIENPPVERQKPIVVGVDPESDTCC